MDWLRRALGKEESLTPGNGTGPRALTPDEIERARMRTRFQEREILKLWKRFAKLGMDPHERVPLDEVATLSELCYNPYADRILMHFFKCDDHGLLSFSAFVDGAHLLSGKSGWEAKLQAAFAVQDMDGDGVISRADLALYLSRSMSPTVRSGIEKAILDADEEVEEEGKLPSASKSRTRTGGEPTPVPSTAKDLITATQVLRAVDSAFKDLRLEKGVLDRHAFIQACDRGAYQKYVIAFV